jgi:acetyl-CoA synthetase
MDQNNQSRFITPSETVIKNANVTEYEKAYKASVDDRENFWSTQAKKLHWFQKWDKVLDNSNPPFFKWFTGGKTNIVYNALDRHQKTETRNKLALIWEGEPGDVRTFSYRA